MTRRSARPRLLARATLLLVLATCSSAQARHETREGFFLQYNLGAGLQSWAFEASSSDPAKEALSGVGLYHALGIGGYVVEDLAVYGELSFGVAGEPTIETTAAAGPGEVDAIGFTGFGLGVQYVLPRYDLYVAVGAQAVYLTVFVPNDFNHNSEYGLGVQARVGKEWWTHDHLSIGVAGYYLGASIPQPDRPERWSVHVLGLGFSATFSITAERL